MLARDYRRFRSEIVQLWSIETERKSTKLVILCRRGKAEEALQQLRKIMSKLKLTVNEEKTRICKVPEGEFDPLLAGTYAI
jgi:hypothetical protein